MTNDDQRESEKPGDPDGRIRRALKNLPPVNASSDFEARLQRRLAEPERPQGSVRWWQKIFAPARIPALGYSLMALVAVGFVSYLMFWRSGIPPENAPEKSVQGTSEAMPPAAGRVTIPPPPLLKQGEGDPESGKNEMQPAGPAVREPRRSMQYDARQLQARKDKISPGMKSDRVETRAEGRLDDRSRSKGVYGDAAKEAAEAPKDVLSSPAPNAVFQQNIPSQAKKAGPMAPQLRKQQNISSESQDLKRSPAVMRGMVSMAAVAGIDSAAIRDSLRLDSLRLDSLRRAKGRKPPG